MSNFWMRALTGAVFVIVLVGSILWRFESFAILFLIITVLGLWEFYGLAEKAGAKPQKVLGTLIGGFLILATSKSYWLSQENEVLWLFVIPALFLLFIVELYRKQPHPFTNIAYTVLGIIYIAVPFATLILLRVHFRHLEEASFIILGYFLLMWTSDTGAYLSGKSFGKTKLFERISPKKTWEGTIGGGVLSIALAVTLGYFQSVWVLTAADWIIIAIIIVVAGNLGDLSESMFKRSINVKDSGSILPGHGGILDRFDAVLVSAPFVFTYIVIAPIYR